MAGSKRRKQAVRPRTRRTTVARAKAPRPGLAQQLREAHQRESATAEILKVIASSPSDVQPVLEAVAQNAAKLCAATDAVIHLKDGELLRFSAHFGEIATMQSLGDARPIGRDSIAGRAALERRQIHVHDMQSEAVEFPLSVQMTRHSGHRTVLTTPLIREGVVLGTISVRRTEVRPFTQKQIALVNTFADQAVIAIENVRLFNETKESLERQTATAEILKVIASSPSDVQPVFDTIVKSAIALCKGMYANVFRYDGDMLHFMATDSLSPRGVEGLKAKYPMRPDASQASGRVILTKAVVRIEDSALDPAYDPKLIVAGGWRRMLGVPMLREGMPLGVIVVAWGEPGPILEHHQALLQTFADQAVIAIENVRLFNETKEALERQTATAEILSVIAGSPSDVQPVFDSIAASALRLCGGSFSVVTRFDGELIQFAAMSNVLPEAADTIRNIWPVRPGRGSATARAISEAKVVQIADIQDDPEYELGDAGKLAKFRSLLAVPMLRDGKPIGAINVNRPQPGEFPAQQIALLQTFADQAVIAIENVRLFNETREALERQTATAEILGVIASSPSDVRPVFDMVARKALDLCGGAFSVVTRYDGQLIHIAAMHAVAEPETAAKLRESFPASPSERGAASRSILTRAIVHLPDVTKDPSYRPDGIAKVGGIQSILAVPLLKGGMPLGSVSVARTQKAPFTPHQIALLKTFADQAVIAIENVRLFNETKEALERQTATAEILKVISSSPTDARPVFEAIVQSGMRLFAGAGVGISIVEGNELRVVAASGNLKGIAEGIHLPISRESASGMAIVERRVVNIKDTEAPDAPPHARDNGRKLNIRSMTQAPMFREGETVGAIGVTLKAPGGLDDKQVALLKTFADQAVIAIENVRLFKELQQRVGQLTALGEVGQAISSTLDLETVLKTIVSRALQLTGLDAGVIYEYDEVAGQFQLRASENFDEEGVATLRGAAIRKGEGAVGTSVVTREPVQVPDTHAPDYPVRLRELLDRFGYRALLAVPLLREEHIIGALMMIRRTPGAFAPEVVELLKTFGTQSAMAIQNARLFREIAEKGKQLEVASHHKSQFLASMSHELRTPLNAILGFNEMVLDQVYGEISEDVKRPLENMQSSGKHLLRLINNVLDLAKIEAGRMELSLSDYSVQDTVTSVHSTLKPLAAEKGLEFVAEVAPDIPLGHGDGGRIAQCLMNLAGNSLKFTKAGRVAIAVAQRDGLLRYSVADTGIGIAPEKIDSLFTEFKQTDATIASEYGGTGLGLSITKKFIEMHGGRIWIESELGKGSTFLFEIPLRANS